MIGVDFSLPNHTHMILAVNFKSVDEAEQALGRGSRGMGKYSTATLVVDKKSDLN